MGCQEDNKEPSRHDVPTLLEEVESAEFEVDALNNLLDELNQTLDVLEKKNEMCQERLKELLQSLESDNSSTLDNILTFSQSCGEVISQAGNLIQIAEASNMIQDVHISENEP